MITLIHGSAELLRAEALARLRAGIAKDPSWAELNTVVLDGRQATLADIQFACDSLPFLADRRLVVIESLLRRLNAASRGRKSSAAAELAVTDDEEDTPQPTGGPGLQRTLLAYLDQVPDTTDLALIEDDVVTGGAVLKRLLELQREGRASVLLCNRPRRSELSDWIKQRARMREVQLDGAALADLAEFVGDDLRQLDQELMKLADYVAGKPLAERSTPVTRAEVRRLVPATRTANVFDLVDALGQGNGNAAGRLLRQALDSDGEQPLRLLALISRQYRLLIQAKELQSEDVKPADIAHRLGIPDWTVPRLLTQAARYSFSSLEAAMGRILAADESIKTGRLSDREAMDVLLAELVAPPAA